MTEPFGQQIFARGMLALTLAAKGFRVFPIRVNGKRPAITGWPERATTDPATIRAWWSQTNYNIGICCGRSKEAAEAVLRLIVLDYDCKEGKDGAATLKAHLAAGLLSTMVVQTPNGMHCYFFAKVHVPNSVSRVARHVDVRGHRGYVVGPGSEIDGKEYVLLDKRMPVLAPETLLELAVRPSDSKADNVTYLNDAGAVGEIDSARAIERAKDWLINSAPEAIEGNSGDKTTVDVARKVRRMGISKEMCLELMAGHWNEEKASPAWRLEGGEGEGPSLSDKVENAYKYASDPIGAHNPEVEFAVIAEVVKASGSGSGGGEDERKTGEKQEKTEEKPKARPRLLNISGWDEVAIPAREWAIVDCVPLRQVGIFSGEGGGGKSTIELMKNVCHVMGLPWFGRVMVQRPTIYVGSEDDETEIQIRLMLIARHYGVKFSDLARMGMHIWPCAEVDPILARVGGKSGTMETTAAYDALYEFCGDVKPINISLDPLTSVFCGSEIDRAQVSEFARIVRRLARVANGSATLLAHPSLQGLKSGSGISGSTAWHNAFRFRHYLSGVGKEDMSEEERLEANDLRVLEFKKNQYGPLGTTIKLRWKAGLFAPVATESEADQEAREGWIDDLFMELLKRFGREGRWVTDNPKAGNYAAKVMVQEAEAKAGKVREAELGEAMRRLFSAGKIHNGKYTSASRHVRPCIVPVTPILN
jgi:RecA-family ATPase